MGEATDFKKSTSLSMSFIVFRKAIFSLIVFSVLCEGIQIVMHKTVRENLKCSYVQSMKCNLWHGLHLFLHL
jgi:hypothetical protein